MLVVEHATNASRRSLATLLLAHVHRRASNEERRDLDREHDDTVDARVRFAKRKFRRTLSLVIVALDVDYREDRVVTACVGFVAWPDAAASFEKTQLSMYPPAEYEPGSFYKRELPYLLAILEGLAPDIVVVDGFVTLDSGTKGLGAHLRDALDAAPIVVGVAKRPWRGGTAGVPIERGDSKAPLFITASGMDVDAAANHVASMHGPHRTPTLLKCVDRLARDSHRD
jgi:deoxyribonuclease V